MDANANTLRNLYSSILKSNEVKEELAKMFTHVRILVVGRSGSGKSTVIRLVVGDKGPRSMSNAEAGVQDINVEWRHPDPDLPLTFHDSNGIDVLGESRVNDIKAFLDSHQRSRDVNERIHLVWYVFSAADNRFTEDRGLLKMLDEYRPALPLILIMTFKDHPKMVEKHISKGNGLEKLLGRISDPGKRKRTRDMMVRLGNDAMQLDDGSIQIESGQLDLDGLKLLTQRSQELMGKECHATWIACQVSDVNAKLEESAKCIIKLKRYRSSHHYI